MCHVLFVISILVVAFGVTFCDPREVGYQQFKLHSLERQIQDRDCPTYSGAGSPDQSLQKLNVGPYVMKYDSNYLQIDAHHHVKRGQLIYQKGIPEFSSIDRDWVQIYALAPDMIPSFLADSTILRRERRGDLYLVGIEVFWSEDGSWRPGEYQRNELVPSSKPLLVAHAKDRPRCA